MVLNSYFFYRRIPEQKKRPISIDFWLMLAQAKDHYTEIGNSPVRFEPGSFFVLRLFYEELVVVDVVVVDVFDDKTAIEILIVK